MTPTTMQSTTHDGKLKYVKTRNRWEASCTCGWGGWGPRNMEGCLRRSLDDHLALHEED